MSTVRPSRPARPTGPAPDRQRPLRSFLLRVVELRRVSVEQVYELVDLQAGRTHRFADLAALQRHLAAASPDDGADGAAS
jgi:hypothetical protein